MKSNLVIRFENAIQIAIYQGACTGQISDGIWENSSPHDHYKIMCDAMGEIAKPGQELGPNFRLPRHYGLNAVAEYSMDDIISNAKVATIFPQFANFCHFYQLPVAGDKITSWVDGKSETLHTFSIEDIAKIEAVIYTENDGKRDLKRVNQIVNGRGGTMVEPKAKVTDTKKVEWTGIKIGATSSRLTMSKINLYLHTTGIQGHFEGTNGVIKFIAKNNCEVGRIEKKWSDHDLNGWKGIAIHLNSFVK